MHRPCHLIWVPRTFHQRPSGYRSEPRYVQYEEKLSVAFQYLLAFELLSPTDESEHCSLRSLLILAYPSRYAVLPFIILLASKIIDTVAITKRWK